MSFYFYILNTLPERIKSYSTGLFLVTVSEFSFESHFGFGCQI